jgi:hypothetical protein
MSKSGATSDMPGLQSYLVWALLPKGQDQMAVWSFFPLGTYSESVNLFDRCGCMIRQVTGMVLDGWAMRTMEMWVGSFSGDG